MGLPDQPLMEAVTELATVMDIPKPANQSLEAWLIQLRHWERGNLN
jgi:hypothetical protein